MTHMWQMYHHPANTTLCGGLMLGQRRRRWSNIKPPQSQCVFFVGHRYINHVCRRRINDGSMSRTLSLHWAGFVNASDVYNWAILLGYIWKKTSSFIRLLQHHCVLWGCIHRRWNGPSVCEKSERFWMGNSWWIIWYKGSIQRTGLSFTKEVDVLHPRPDPLPVSFFLILDIWISASLAYGPRCVETWLHIPIRPIFYMGPLQFPSSSFDVSFLMWHNNRNCYLDPNRNLWSNGEPTIM